MSLEIEVVYKSKKSSSGRIENGKMLLWISNLLPKEVQLEHIENLSKRLLEKYHFVQDKCWEKSEIVTNQKLNTFVQEINKKYFNFNFNKAVFHKQKTRWGSCSLKTRNIYISDRLKGAPSDVLNYLVIHELCHFKEPNHSKKFWKLVQKHCPNYILLRKKLNNYGYFISSKQ